MSGALQGQASGISFKPQKNRRRNAAKRRAAALWTTPGLPRCNKGGRVQSNALSLRCGAGTVWLASFETAIESGGVTSNHYTRSILWTETIKSFWRFSPIMSDPGAISSPGVLKG